MNEKLYTLCGAMALALAACSDDSGNIGGTSTEPNTVYAEQYWLWNPLAGDMSVNKARYASILPENVEADGHWFWETRKTDENDGGRSSITWPVPLGSGEDSLSTVIESCHGICGVANLDLGTMTYNPYVSVGFVIARDSAGNPTPVDVSDWGGVCITYTSEAAPSLVLDLGDSLSEIFGDGAGFPAVALSKAAVYEKSRCYSWSEFKLPSWVKNAPEYWTSDAGEKGAKQLVGLMFKVQNVPGSYNFNIKYIGMKAEEEENTDVE